jgi:hypothetical protein
MPLSNIRRKAGTSQANGFPSNGQMCRPKQRKNGNCAAH